VGPYFIEYIFHEGPYSIIMAPTSGLQTSGLGDIWVLY